MPAVGQFYAVQTDDEDPYNVYGGLQDNGVWVGSSSYKYSTSWQSTGSYPYKSLLVVMACKYRLIYATIKPFTQVINLAIISRIDKKTNDRKYITPRHELGERPIVGIGSRQY